MLLGRYVDHASESHLLGDLIGREICIILALTQFASVMVRVWFAPMTGTRDDHTPSRK
jgi:hypothetical protein